MFGRSIRRHVLFGQAWRTSPVWRADHGGWTSRAACHWVPWCRHGDGTWWDHVHPTGFDLGKWVKESHTAWWFQTWLLFSISYGNGMSSSQLTFTPSFFRGVGWGRYTTNQHIFCLGWPVKQLSHVVTLWLIESPLTANLNSPPTLRSQVRTR